jgi:copper/silver efflux system protein
MVMGPSMISSENGLLRGTVLMNVRGRDVGGFVDEASRAVLKNVSMPQGYYVQWSGQFENQISAKKRLQLVIPVVLLIILLLLYRTYNSWKEAAHVLLAVPFALTGGVFLVKILGYNFSVAVWVGFIALCGTAVQTGVVMVIYLEEAVARRIAADGTLTREGLHAAVMKGALLRLRPKVMTVATVVAGLLPLMWSTRTGAEFMKPLAAPVLGGMVSSLLHVLVVTPVIFTWLRERELRKQGGDPNRHRMIGQSLERAFWACFAMVGFYGRFVGNLEVIPIIVPQYVRSAKNRTKPQNRSLFSTWYTIWYTSRFSSTQLQ